MGSTSRRAFTMIECAALTCAAGAGLACLSAVQPEDGPSPAEKATWEAKDQNHVRVTVQALTIFATATGGDYPLPSAMDPDDATVAEKGRAKDTTGNLFSILIWNGAIATETCISPAEVNESIKQREDYWFDQPPTAAKPVSAMWDPAFSADFTGETIGNVSYAHLQPSEGRLDAWNAGSEHAALEPVVANRGPEIAAVTAVGEDGRPDVRLAKEDSNTLRIHGPEASWEGMVAYNDGHAGRVDSLRPTATKTADGKPTWISYNADEGAEHLDVYFFDEKDDPEGDNFFLGIFTKAGAEPEDFQAIWD